MCNSKTGNLVGRYTYSKPGDEFIFNVNYIYTQAYILHMAIHFTSYQCFEWCLVCLDEQLE